jgi:hypothetical protein
MSGNIADYLSKQIFIERNIVRFVKFHYFQLISSQVTYRSLSREFGIHVNTAKTCVLFASPREVINISYL